MPDESFGVFRIARVALPQFLNRPLCENPLLLKLWQGAYFLALTAASYVIVTNYLFETVEIVGPSMAPTLKDSDHFVLNRWIYHIREPRVSEIVVIRDPLDDGFSVKRVIAAPGDCLYIRQGFVFVNGRRLVEPYLLHGTLTLPASLGRSQLILCGKDDYVVLGDNRANSLDSRQYGVVPRDRILGVIWN